MWIGPNINSSVLYFLGAIRRHSTELTIASFLDYLFGASYRHYNATFLMLVNSCFSVWSYSEFFLVTDGIGLKQGGVLSPVLFCVYLNELELALSAAKVGCYVCSKC